MPANINNAVSAGVMPYTLATAFSESRTYPVQVNEYVDGCSQRRVLASTSRKRFRISKRLTTAELNALRLFYISNVGKAFSFYPFKKDFDATGQNSTGRYLVRFEGPWSETSELGRNGLQIELAEVA